MRITGLEARTYRYPLNPPFRAAWDPVPRMHADETVVVVHTDEGIDGIAGGAPVPDVDLLSDLLAGVDVADTDRISQIGRQVDFHHGRNWTVEVAAFDALARSRHEPLWEMLGGTRRAFPAYASSGERLPAGERVERAAAWRQAGVQAVKIRLAPESWRDDLAVVAAVKEAVGEEMDIMVDANQGWRMPGDDTPPWNLATAAECAGTAAELGVYWLEEPLPTDDVSEYVRLRAGSGVRIAAGEMIRSLTQTRQLIEAGAVDVIQSDVVLAGGIVGAAEVAAWADEAGIVWSPHTWSTGLGLVANLHAALAYSTAEYIEVPFDPPGWSSQRRDWMLPAPLEIDSQGFIAVPDGPGLGVDLDLGHLERYRIA